MDSVFSHSDVVTLCRVSAMYEAVGFNTNISLRHRTLMYTLRAAIASNTSRQEVMKTANLLLSELSDFPVEGL